MSSKYSTLPDIDDQPDVYETPDVNETSVNVTYETQSSDEDDNEEVVKSRVSVREAASKFKDSIVDSTDADFSDRLTRRKKAMYRTFVRRPPGIESSEYEILPKNLTLDETPLQKLRRLMYEVQELNDEVEKQKEPIDTKETISQSEILSQIAYLQSDLARLNQQVSDTDDLSAKSGYARSINEAKSLIKQLEAFKNLSLETDTIAKEEGPTTGEDPEATNDTKKNNMVTYELYYTPETVKMQKETKLSDIDDRIAKLESVLGSRSGEDVESLPSHIAASSLIHSLSKLEQQVAVLAQPRQLEMVARRVKVLNSDMERLNELKSGRKDTYSFALSSFTPSPNTQTNTDNANKDGSNDTETKINKLFNTVEKIDPLLNLTPALLTRLKALQSLHLEAASFSQSVNVISNQQTKMADELQSLSSTCNLLKSSLKENDEAVSSNIKVIDERITDIIRRITDLQGNEEI